ncbi:hypothetical protein MSAN_00893100 [Mycena sanguinolenta]|uniref:Uncharacterized protein n=1 Tax=Mycena sanguinolenta TaxID=230812 RepID=A0A8H6YY19_9AGAR|nr:hypothetical protein MSAN_00893100 [Mycena sanguinolenta]
MGCRGSSKDGEECECDAYDAPEKKDAPSLCRECGHGKSKHAPIPSIWAESSSAANKRAVLTAFNSHSDKKVAEVLPVKERVTDFSTARKDALKNYRPSAPESKLKKTPANKTASTSKDTVAISEIILLTCGIKNYHLKVPKAPSRHEIDTAAHYQCVATNSVLNIAWTHEELSTELQKLFPRPFQSSGEAGWRVLTKDYKKLHVVCNDHPTGADVVKYKVSKTAQHGVQLYIGTLFEYLESLIFTYCSTALVKTVSQSVYDTWYTGPEIVQESSSIHGEEDTLDTFINDEEDSSSNSTAAGSSDDYDPIQDPDAESDDNMEVIPSSAILKQII